MDIYRLRRQMLHEILNQPTLRIHVEQRLSIESKTDAFNSEAMHTCSIGFFDTSKTSNLLLREAKEEHPGYFEPLYTHLASERRIGTVEQEERQ